MPIMLVSVDSKNEKLVEIRNLEKVIDVLFISEHPGSLELMNQVGLYTDCLKLDALNPRRDDETEEDVQIRFQSIVNVIKGLGVGSAMIISHHSVFNTWKKDTISDEWETIEM